MQMFNHDQIEFEVEKFKLEDVPKDIGMGLRRTDTGKVLSIVSKDYEKVQYKDIVTNIENALVIASNDSEVELDLSDTEFTTNVINGGSKLELRAKFHGQKTYLSDYKNQESLITPEMVFRTSHDSTWANNGMMGVWRSKCWNTLVNGDKLAYIYGRHTKKFDVLGFADKIGTATKYISGKGMEKMKGWYNTPVKREEITSLFKNTLAKKTDNVSRKNEGNKVMLSNLMKIFDEECRHIVGRGRYDSYAQNTKGTLWTAYNAATYWSSHPSLMSGKSGGILYEGNVTPNEKSTKVKIREDKVTKMLNSDHWKELEMFAA